MPTVFTNLSVSAAFYGLLKFYHAVQDDLVWCRPWPKFLCIKGVVFMTFWQGLAINILAKTSSASGSTGTHEQDLWAKQSQSFLICIEMLVASIAHFYVFPHYEWREGYEPQTTSKTKFGDNLALRDFVGDLKIILGRQQNQKIKNKGGEGENTSKEERVAGDINDERGAVQGAAEDGQSLNEEDLESGEALARIQQNLHLLEINQEAQLAAYKKQTTAAKSERQLPNSGGENETSSLLVDSSDHAQQPEKLERKKSAKKGKSFRPRNSRLHR